MGGAWHEGALYVASPPHIWRLEDTTGDGVADRRDVLVDKFGYTGNAASIHGCISGPDGRLYWCDGFHGHEFKDESGQITSQREGSYIFSCLPDGSDVRIHCGGGMDNPVEVDFTSEGEMLGTVNILYTRPRVDCLVHWLYGGAYPHRERVLDELQVTGDLLGPVHRFGHVAVSGTQRYRSGAMEPDWRDDFFVTFFNSGKVVRVELAREGASFRATQREFLSCPNRDFHPTDVAEDADGSLLIVDTGGWFYRGCPTSQFAKPDVLGGIYRVSRSGMATPDDGRGNQIEWSSESDAQLVTLLGDPRFAVRERAITECAKRGDSLILALRESLLAKDQQRRLGAIWALTRMIGSGEGIVSAKGALRVGLDSPDLSVRLAACRGVATYPDAAAVDRLIELLHGDDPAIRREAAKALGRIGDVAAVPALLAALGRAGSTPSEPAARSNSPDRSEEHAIVYALIEINDPQATRAGFVVDNALTRRGALIALDQMSSDGLTVDDVIPLAATDDAELRRAAAEVFIRRPEWSSRSADILTLLLGLALQFDGPTSEWQTAAVIRKLASQSLADDAVAALIGRALDNSTISDETRGLLLAAIADSQSVPLHRSWVAPFERLLGSDDPVVIQSAVAALAAIETDRFHDRLTQFGDDQTQPVPLRVAALEAASGQPGRLTDASLGLLIEQLTGELSESLSAAQQIGSSSLSKAQLVRLAPQLTDAGPSHLQELLRPFERSRDADVAAAFLAAMKQARGLTSLAPHQFSDVIKRYPPELLPAANELLQQIRAEEERKLTRLDALVPLLAKGNAARGRELFFAEKSKCATCHRIANKGEQIGPDLTTIGANRSAHDLLESIVFPSATIVRDYEPYTAITTDGRVLSGLIARETSDTLYLQQQAGDPLAVRRNEIDELIPAAVSIMPNGLEKALSEPELADVIAFLRSLKGSANDVASGQGGTEDTKATGTGP
jgi:putative heme-binding domain-containing protein